ncbi:MAG: YlqD family protein [Clostridia bacterium]
MSMENSKDTIEIITPVTIKSIVTEDLITSIKNRIEDSLETLTQKIHQLDYQKQYLEMQKNKDDSAKEKTYAQIRQVENDIRSQIQRIKDQEAQVDSWELGQEVVMTKRDSISRYKVGDKFHEDEQYQIIVKDGVIQEIRR